MILISLASDLEVSGINFVHIELMKNDMAIKLALNVLEASTAAVIQIKNVLEHTINLFVVYWNSSLETIRHVDLKVVISIQLAE